MMQQKQCNGAMINLTQGKKKHKNNEVPFAAPKIWYLYGQILRCEMNGPTTKTKLRLALKKLLSVGVTGDQVKFFVYQSNFLIPLSPVKVST